ncbi:MAG: hypothetical protein ACR2LZ_03830 [Pyrinomonadaceae bacterium]
MTQQEFIEEIKRLSIAERIALIKAISRGLREDLQTDDGGARTVPPEAHESTGQSERERKIAAVRQLRGILKTDRPPPSDEEWKEDYVKYLTEKYS